MKKVALYITLLLALCASVAQAQVVGVFPTRANNDQQVVLGSHDINHGGIHVVTGAANFTVSSFTFKVRECSNWPASAAPFFNFSLSNGPLLYPATETWIDQERAVTFSINTVQRANTTSTYMLHSDVAGYDGSSPMNKHCFRMALERTGIPTKILLNGNFPIRLGAKTLLRSKGTIAFSPIGATTGRVRTVADDVFRINITANSAFEIHLEQLAPLIFGTASPGGYYEVIDDLNGEVSGRGWLSLNGNIAWEVFGEPSFGEYFVTAGTTRTFRVRVNSTLFHNQAGVADNLTISLPNLCDFKWDTTFGNGDGPGLCAESQTPAVTVLYE